MIPASAKSKPIEVWFQDEARIGQKGTLAYVWAKLARGQAKRSLVGWTAEGLTIDTKPGRRATQNKTANTYVIEVTT